MEELFGMIMPEKGIKLEKDFTTMFGRFLKDKGFFSYKISDADRSLKPFDMIIVTNKNSYFCEIKVIIGETINEKNFQPNQRKALSKICELGGLAIAVIYSKKHNVYKVALYSELFL